VSAQPTWLMHRFRCAKSRRATVTAEFAAATFVAAVIAYLLTLANPDLLHWFLIPLVASGGLVGVDVYRWAVGEIDLFDPIGLVAVLGVHFFFFAPLIQILADTKLLYVTDQPADYRPWLGWMACVNFLGLLCYRAMLAICAGKRREPEVIWTLRSSRFLPILGSAILAAVAAEAYILTRFHGIGGLIQSFTGDADQFNNTGWLFTISESLPVLLMIGVTTLWWRKRVSWLLLAPLVLFVVVLVLLLGGWRGSRQNVIWTILWALGMIHYGMRPVPRKVVGAFALVMLAFMYFYGFYKYTGAEGIRALTDSEWRAQAVERSGRSFGSVLVQDLARTDVQAFALYRITTGPYEYAMGRTYLGAFNLLVPRVISLDRLPTKVKWTTDLEYGEKSYESNHHPSSRVYGLAGEAMLNFGPLGVPFAFAVFGYLVAKMSNLSRSIDPGDCRVLLVPFLACIAMVVLAHDLDVDLFIAIKNSLLPFSVIYFGSDTRSLRRTVARFPADCRQAVGGRRCDW
jgi:hypothetical protein